MKHNQHFDHFSVSEMKQIRDLLTSLTHAIEPKLVTAPPEEQLCYKEYSQEKRLFAGKIVEYKLRHPELSSDEVDWDAFNLLFPDNVFLKSTILYLQALVEKMEMTRMTYDMEIFRSSLKDYENTRAHYETGKTAYERKYKELKPFAEPTDG